MHVVKNYVILAIDVSGLLTMESDVLAGCTVQLPGFNYFLDKPGHLQVRHGRMSLHGLRSTFSLLSLQLPNALRSSLSIMNIRIRHRFTQQRHFFGLNNVESFACLIS